MDFERNSVFPNLLENESEWFKPHTCVEIVFSPAGKHHKLDPHQSVKVQAELRTKKEQAAVPARFKNASELPKEGNGNVVQTQEEFTEPTFK